MNKQISRQVGGPRGHVVGCIGLVGLLCLSACGLRHDGAVPSPSPQATAPPMTLFEEEGVLRDGGLFSFQRSIVSVPNRRAVSGRSGIDTAVRSEEASERLIEVEFYRFERDADADPNVPPLFLLRGGPGFAGLGSDLERPGYFEGYIRPYLSVTDVVVPGQRGFGTSTNTECEPTAEIPFPDAMSMEVQKAAFDEAAARCKAKWEEAGLDLEGFNVVEATDDVVDIARALGYESIQFWAVSFGSHWGMTLIREHPEMVARATLGAIEGPDHTYDVPSGTLATLERIAAEAEASPAFAEAIPAAGLLNAYRDLIAVADADPIEVEIAHPETEEPITVLLGGDELRELVTGYSSATSFSFRMPSWVRDLLALIQGDRAAAARRLVEGRLDRRMRNAAFMSYECGSGVSAQRDHQIRNDPAVATVGETWQFYDILCESWGVDLGEAFRQPFRTSVPVVLTHGNWDKSTPYENALEARSFFQQHKFIHIERGAHGALMEAVVDAEGFEDAMLEWVATGDASHLPDRVELKPVQWSRGGA